MSGRLGAAAAVAVGGGHDGVLQLLAPGRHGAVAPARPAAAAAPHAAAAVAAMAAGAVSAAALAPGGRAGEVGVGLVSRLDGAVGATVAEMRGTRLKLKTSISFQHSAQILYVICTYSTEIG